MREVIQMVAVRREHHRLLPGEEELQIGVGAGDYIVGVESEGNEFWIYVAHYGVDVDA